jgi:DNA-binding transcriptional ArsR family regulator
LTLHLPTVLTEIRSLLDEPAAGAPAARASVEKTLTDGYAHALAIEGERLRIERRLREIVHADRREERADAELGSLTQALGETDRELRALRALLAELRAHAL